MKQPLLIKFLTVVFVFIFNSMLVAQVADSAAVKEKNNIFKINVPALFLKNISVQYEKKVSRKNSFAIAMRYRPNTNIPFKKMVEDLITDTLVKTDLFKVGNIGITPEYRFYLGKKGAFHGFYIGPFISYNHYESYVPVNYIDYVDNVIINKTATFKGGANTFTVGFQLGAQWKLSDKIYLDWWITGPNYGFVNGAFNFAGALNDIEQISLESELKKIQLVVPLNVIEIPKGSPNGSGASFNVKGSWAGIRAFGLNVGYRF